MKLRSRTLDNKYVVEMTENEYVTLRELALAVEGCTLLDINLRVDPGLLPGADLSTTLNAIRTFSTTLTIANELKELSERTLEVLKANGQS